MARPYRDRRVFHHIERTTEEGAAQHTTQRKWRLGRMRGAKEREKERKERKERGRFIVLK